MDYSIVFNAQLTKDLDKVIPVNPHTGLRDSILHKYEIALSDSEKANLQHYLDVQEVSNPAHQLSDKDLIALCPSRFVSSLSDTKELAIAMRSIVQDLDSADVSSSSEPKSSPEPTSSSGEGD